MSDASELLKQLRAMGVQLTLEADVLRLNAPKGALTPELQTRLKAAKPEILELLRGIQLNGRRSSTAAIEHVARHTLMPLSYAQQRLWFLSQVDPDNAAYALLFLMRMEGDLDVEALEHAFHHIVLRHESLRTCFVQREGTPYTTIRDGRDWKLERRVLTRYQGETLESAAGRFSEETIRDSFNLETGPLFRGYLLQTGKQEHVVAVSMHHIISDGWSLSVLGRELVANYRALHAGESLHPHDLPVQYVDYAQWQRQWLESGELERQMRYWRRQLDGAPAVAVFPPDHRRLPDDGLNGRRAEIVFSAEFAKELGAFSRAHDATLFMTLLSAFMLLLSRYSGQKDVVVGSPSANRTRTELSELIGFFVNNLVLRVQVDDGISFLDLLRRVREVTLGAYEHQDAPFDHLVRALQGDRNPEYAPLFQTMFILHNFQMEEVRLPGLTVSPLEVDSSIARFDLSAEVYPYRDELRVYFVYRADIYERATIEELLHSFEYVLRSVMRDPHALVEDVPLMPRDVKQALLARGKGAAVEMSSPVLVHEALERFAAETPGKTAISAGDDTLSYAELNACADALAARLRLAGVGRGVLVPVCLKRSTELVVTLLAVLKTGAAYVPLDPIYPRHRIAGIFEDVRPVVVVTERELLPLVSDVAHDGERHCILVEDVDFSASTVMDEGSRARATSEDLAYVIFTSGSTGRPKGVEISHGALTNLLESMRRAPGFTSDDRMLAVTTVSFDIAGLEIFLPIYAGGELVLALAPRDLPVLLADIEREKPTIMQATPALWQTLVSAGWNGDPEMMMLCGGEALTPQLASALLARGKTLWNMYGPTETTIWSSALRIEEARGESVPIGGPIHNTAFYVLDARREPVPMGVAGELYIGGAGLARGYFRRPELTAERFVKAPFGEAPFGDSERLYRTGDLVRWLRDGTLEFIGRTDFQVKLRGFRIELGEIEHALREQPEVAECVVLLRDIAGQNTAGQSELVAYLVLRSGETLPHTSLRQRLQERLPEYMVPASSVALREFPRLPNGKLDRSRLPAPEADESAMTGPVEDQALNPTEGAIAMVFRELLHTDRIGLEQRFFDIGAHSLMLVKAHDRLRRELDPELRLVSFFQYPTVATLAQHIDQGRKNVGEIAHAGQR
jgi:amino acid adenylation domain-containing protein